MKQLVPALAFLLAACGGGPPPPPSQQPIAAVTVEERLYYDNSGAYPDSLRLVVRDAQSFSQVWTEATRNQSAPPPRPQVDFESSMVLLVAAGRMTPEDRIRVDSVGVRSVPRTDGGREDVLTIVVSTVRGCGRLEVDAYPVEIVRLPKFEGRIEYMERSVRDCPSLEPRAVALVSTQSGAPPGTGRTRPEDGGDDG